MLTKVRLKEWGNSLGVTIPKEIVVKGGLKADDEVSISINKKENLEDFFGKLKEKGKFDLQKMKDESRRLWKMK